MNYFAHALPFLDRPYLAVATGVPDMLLVVDRRVRVRSRHVAPFVEDEDPVLADVARGMAQHFRDDAVFHDTRAFAELNLAASAVMRDALAGDPSMRPRLLGHLLVEIFLDAALIEERPERLDAYYEAVAAVDEQRIEAALNRMSPRPTIWLAEMIRRIRVERFLWDYLDEGPLLVRLNQIMRRVRLPGLPSGVEGALGLVRRDVRRRKDELMAGIPAGESRLAGRADAEREKEVA